MKKREFFQKHLKISDERMLDELERHSWLWRAKRRDHIMEEGELLKDIPFLVSGILKACYRDSSGEENVYCFAYREGEVAASINSLHGEVRAISTVKAITECELCYVSLEVLQNLVRTVPELGYTYEMLLSESMRNMVEHERIINQCDSIERYAWFAEKYPELTDRRISQKDIASYLHMTAEHLCRIRSRKK
ncbi:MAG: Crp/Fnr family transcriptional regulator [Lachnospiraceae bacterium]|nr:Crp/Fnr family transcriptional regulator [Lachnospiraceae bacterium]